MDVSLDVRQGEWLSVVGPSGAGKTTLLRLIAGLDRPNRGTIRIGQRDVTALPPQDRDVGLAPQRPALYPHLNVRENLAIGLNLRPASARPSKSEIRQRVEEAAELLSIVPLLAHWPHQLSGGEQQRVMLGRLLVRRPALWLLDEPYSHLDLPLRKQLQHDILLLRERFLPTIIFVTHDPVEALTSGDRLAVLLRGRVRQVGPPAAVLAQPASSEVAGHLGWPPMNLTTGVLIRSDATASALQFAAADGAFRLPMPAELVTHGAEGQPVTVGVRPEALRLLSDSPADAGDLIVLPNWEVRRVESLPPAPLVFVGCGRQEWSLWWHGKDAPRAGSKLALGVNRDALHWFGGHDGKRVQIGA